MLKYLSKRNALRQIKDYFVYVITLILSISLIYSFNLVSFSREVINALKGSWILPFTVTFATIIIVVILGWLICYINKFILKKRNKEFSVYMLQGIDNMQILKLFLGENRILCTFSLVLGLIVGYIFYQLLKLFFLKLMQVEFSLEFDCSILPTILTILYFFLIFGISERKTKKYLKKVTIRELILSDSSPNFMFRKKNRILFWGLIFVEGVGISLCISTFVRKESDFRNLIGMVLLVFSTFGILIYIPEIINNRLNKEDWRYSVSNLYLWRTLSRKIKELGMTLAGVTILLTFVFLTINFGNFFNLLIDERSNSVAFDFAISSPKADVKINTYKSFIEKEYPKINDFSYKIYTSNTNDFTCTIDGIKFGKFVYTSYFDEIKNDCFIRKSDYIKLREMLGLSSISIPDNTYSIHCSDVVSQQLIAYAKEHTLKIGERVLQYNNTYTEAFMQEESIGNGNHFVIIVPDESVERLNLLWSMYVGTTPEEIRGTMVSELESMVDKESKEGEKVVFTGKGKIKDLCIPVLIGVVLPLYYLASILCASAATILTVQILSETSTERNNFRKLSMLGISKRESKKILKKYFSIFYFLPLLFAIIMSNLIYMSLTVNIKWNVFVGRTMKGIVQNLSTIGFTILLFLIIYLIYYVGAYSKFKQNIL